MSQTLSYMTLWNAGHMPVKVRFRSWPRFWRTHVEWRCWHCDGEWTINGEGP